MKSIKKESTVATCTLLSQHSEGVLTLKNTWEIDSSYLHCEEADDHFKVNKFVAKVGGDASNTDRVNLTAILDTMSGSTPSGSVKQSTPSFTGASGGAKPDVAWVGMTTPKQKKWADHNREHINSPIIGSIGPVFDFFAGTFNRAPR